MIGPHPSRPMTSRQRRATLAAAMAQAPAWLTLAAATPGPGMTREAAILCLVAARRLGGVR